ncbi:MAG: IS982 family transposase [Cellvibrionaceae bacterium]
MSNLQSVYNKIYDLLHEIEVEDYFLNQRKRPKLNDKGLIALSLAAETLGIDSERFLFKQLPEHLVGLVERSVYNRRLRRLSFKIESLRQSIVSLLEQQEGMYVVDSMPLEVCKLSRANRSRVCQEYALSSPDFGYCAAQDSRYFGFKLHAVCTPDGVLKMFDISKASTHDIHYLNDVQAELSHCILLGDKGYLSRQWQTDLFESQGIQLETPMRKNQKSFKVFPQVLSRARKRIETLFSQLCDQFMVRRNYAKSFTGFARRLTTKITALTIIQWDNMRNGRNMNNIKVVLS